MMNVILLWTYLLLIISCGEIRIFGLDFLTFCPKLLSKTTSPGKRILSKNTKIPTQGQGSYVKCSYPEAMLFILSIHRDQTRQKNCTLLSN